MEEPKHNDLAFFDPEINGVWKSPEQSTPEFVVNLWVKQWISWNFTGADIKHPKEFLAELRYLPLIPRITGNNIFLHFGKES